MNLFEQHSNENKQQAKAALVGVAAKTIARYVSAQKFLNKHLSGGGKSQEDGACLLCIVDKTTKLMAKLEVQVGEIEKTYKLMFGEKLDTKAITSDAIKDFYPLARAKKSSSETKVNVDMPDDVPQEVGTMIDTITNALKKMKGSGDRPFNVKVIDMSDDKGTYGVDPREFDNPFDFYEAVKAARKAHDSKPGEEVIKEAVIHTAEESSKSSVKPLRGRKAGIDNKPEDSKLN